MEPESSQKRAVTRRKALQQRKFWLAIGKNVFTMRAIECGTAGPEGVGNLPLAVLRAQLNSGRGHAELSQPCSKKQPADLQRVPLVCLVLWLQSLILWDFLFPEGNSRNKDTNPVHAQTGNLHSRNPQRQDSFREVYVRTLTRWLYRRLESRSTPAIAEDSGFSGTGRSRTFYLNQAV